MSQKGLWCMRPPKQKLATGQGGLCRVMQLVDVDVYVTVQDHTVECVTIRDSSSDTDEQAVVNLISPSPKKKKRLVP